VLVLLSAWVAGAREGGGGMSAEGRAGWQGGRSRLFSDSVASMRAHAMARRGGATPDRVPEGSGSEEVLAASRAAAGMLHRQLSDTRPADRLEDAKRAVALLHEQLQQVRAGVRPDAWRGQALSTSSPGFQRHQILRGGNHPSERGTTGISRGEPYAQHANGRLLSLAGFSGAGRTSGDGKRGAAEMREKMKRVAAADRAMDQGAAQSPAARASDRREAAEVRAHASCWFRRMYVARGASELSWKQEEPGDSAACEAQCAAPFCGMALRGDAVGEVVCRDGVCVCVRACVCVCVILALTSRRRFMNPTCLC
jgi:hypothetical protein